MALEDIRLQLFVKEFNQLGLTPATIFHLLVGDRENPGVRNVQLPSYLRFFMRYSIAVFSRYIPAVLPAEVQKVIEAIELAGYYAGAEGSYNDLIRLLYVLVSGKRDLLSDRVVSISQFEDLLIWARLYENDEQIQEFWNWLETEDIYTLGEKKAIDSLFLSETYFSAPTKTAFRGGLHWQCETLFEIHQQLLGFTLIADKTPDPFVQACFYSYIEPIVTQWNQHQEKIALLYELNDSLLELLWKRANEGLEDFAAVSQAAMTQHTYDAHLEFLSQQGWDALKSPLNQYLYQYAEI